MLVVALVGDLQRNYQVCILQLGFFGFVDYGCGELASETEQTVGWKIEGVVGIVDRKIGSG